MSNFIRTNEQYNSGFEVNEYQGRYSLISAREYQGKIFQKWGEIETGRDNITWGDIIPLLDRYGLRSDLDRSHVVNKYLYGLRKRRVQRPCLQNVRRAGLYRQ